MQAVTNLPGAIVIGAQRAGTTRFYQLLVQHQEVAPAARKEVHFYDLRYGRGLEWYAGMFPSLQDRIGVEASPYYIYHPLGAQRIWESQPEVKIIVLLRNPVDRAYSNYHHEVCRQEEKLSFEEALDKEDSRIKGEERKIIETGIFSVPHNQYSYKHRGYYAEQLSRYYVLFPRENILLIESGELYRGEEATLSRTFEFLGLEPARLKVDKFTGQRKYSKMSTGTREMLLEHFSPYNKKLEDLVGREFNWSC